MNLTQSNPIFYFGHFKTTYVSQVRFKLMIQAEPLG